MRQDHSGTNNAIQRFTCHTGSGSRHFRISRKQITSPREPEEAGGEKTMNTEDKMSLQH